jgi:hypothetical protein
MFFFLNFFFIKSMSVSSNISLSILLLSFYLMALLQPSNLKVRELIERKSDLAVASMVSVNCQRNGK